MSIIDWIRANEEYIDSEIYESWLVGISPLRTAEALMLGGRFTYTGPEASFVDIWSQL